MNKLSLSHTLNQLMQTAPARQMDWQGQGVRHAKVKADTLDPQRVSHAKLFNKHNVKHIRYQDSATPTRQEKQDSISRYEQNRKLLAKIFVVWSMVLLLLLLNVFGIL